MVNVLRYFVEIQLVVGQSILNLVGTGEKHGRLKIDIMTQPNGCWTWVGENRNRVRALRAEQAMKDTKQSWPNKKR